MLAFLVFLLLPNFWHLSDSLQGSLVSLLIPFRVHPPLLTPFTLSAAFLTLPQTANTPLTWKMPLCFSLSFTLLHTTYSGSHLQTTLECYLYCPGLGSCYSFSLLTEDLCSGFELLQSSGMFGIWAFDLDPSQCLMSASRSWQKLSAAGQPGLQDVRTKNKRKRSQHAKEQIKTCQVLTHSELRGLWRQYQHLFFFPHKPQARQYSPGCWKSLQARRFQEARLTCGHTCSYSCFPCKVSG